LEPASLLTIQVDDNNVGSKPASPVVVAHTNENNGGRLKLANPVVVVGAVDERERDKVEGKDKLPGREDLDVSDDAVGDSGGGAGSNSKFIKISLDSGDVQDDVIKEDAPTPMATIGGGSIGKGKSVATE
jgi:hypothetical protein